MPASAPMTMSLEGRKRLSLREGIRLKAYRDSKGIPTIGVGHTSAAGEPKVTMGMTITAQQCDEILMRDLALFENSINRTVKVPLQQHEFDALVSIAFNVGPKFANSTTIRKLNAGDRSGAAKAILMWNKPPEIVGRRHTEYEQFVTPYKTA
jgi:lysozyme